MMGRHVSNGQILASDSSVGPTAKYAYHVRFYLPWSASLTVGRVNVKRCGPQSGLRRTSFPVVVVVVVVVVSKWSPQLSTWRL